MGCRLEINSARPHFVCRGEIVVHNISPVNHYELYTYQKERISELLIGFLPSL